jgi:hypothetical protein
LRDLIFDFTKPFLAIGREIFGNVMIRESENRGAAAHIAERPAMPSYGPELIQTMRAALDEVMTKIPLEHATPGIKAALAECILKAAAAGQTSHDGLVAAASEQIRTIVWMLS